MNIKFLVAAAGAVAAAALACAEPATLVIDKDHSSIAIAVTATGDSFTGKLANYTIDATAEPAGAQVDTLVLHFRFADVQTGKQSRDKKMHAWQQTDKYPDAAFVLARVTPGANGPGTASGQLSFHGIERPIAFPVTIKAAGGQYTIDGDAVVDTQAYGLPIIKLMGLFKVDPHVHVLFHLQGIAKP